MSTLLIARFFFKLEIIVLSSAFSLGLGTATVGPRFGPRSCSPAVQLSEAQGPGLAGWGSFSPYALRLITSKPMGTLDRLTLAAVFGRSPKL